MARKNINTTLEDVLYSEIQILSIKLSQKTGKKINANDLIEEGMKYILEKYENFDAKNQTHD